MSDAVLHVCTCNPPTTSKELANSRFDSRTRKIKPHVRPKQLILFHRAHLNAVILVGNAATPSRYFAQHVHHSPQLIFNTQHCLPSYMMSYRQLHDRCTAQKSVALTSHPDIHTFCHTVVGFNNSYSDGLPLPSTSIFLHNVSDLIRTFCDMLLRVS